jgi:hypothetical protein
MPLKRETGVTRCKKGETMQKTSKQNGKQTRKQAKTPHSTKTTWENVTKHKIGLDIFFIRLKKHKLTND